MNGLTVVLVCVQFLCIISFSYQRVLRRRCRSSHRSIRRPRFQQLEMYTEKTCHSVSLTGKDTFHVRTILSCKRFSSGELVLHNDSTLSSSSSSSSLTAVSSQSTVVNHTDFLDSPALPTLQGDTSSCPKDHSIVIRSIPTTTEAANRKIKTSWTDLLSQQAVGNSSITSAALVWLNVVAVLWGTQHAVIKQVVVDCGDAGLFTLVRFAMAASIASLSRSVFQINDQRQQDRPESDTVAEISSYASTSSTLRFGAELGLWMFLGFAFQAIGLQYTTAQKSGFLLYLNVKLVPFLARFLLGREITIATWVSAGTALAGTLLLATQGSPLQVGGSSYMNASQFLTNWNVGDLWSIAAAFASAMFIVRLERASRQVSNAAALNESCLWVVTLLSAVWTFAESDFLPPHVLGGTTGQQPTMIMLWDDLQQLLTRNGVQLLYLSGIATALANWIQTKAQRHVPAERAAIVYAMDPVYGAVFSFWLLGEQLDGWTAWLGASLIVLAAVSNAWMDLHQNTAEHNADHCDDNSSYLNKSDLPRQACPSTPNHLEPRRYNR